MREQVCIYMCPYARFQGVMFDRDTLLITYDPTRGEPRGSRAKKADYKSMGLGDCVDCDICVQVCPTGIDIRQGQQYECIGCAACIDACNQVMDKMSYPRGLIRYSTLNAVDQHFTWQDIVKRVLRPRVLLYAAILGTIVAVASVSLALRVPVKVDVIRDRATLAREVEDGRIENVYRLQVMNTEEVPRFFSVTASGIPDIKVVGMEQPLSIGPASSQMFAFRLRASPEGLEKGTHKIEIHVVANDTAGAARPEIFSVREKSIFYKP
jgi:cytochrome c oxidase accessory protein FixG